MLPTPAIVRIIAALTTPRLLQSVNHAAGRDRFDVQHNGQSSLIDPGIAMDAHEHTPLRAGNAGVARHFIKPPPHESRNPRKDISNALSHKRTGRAHVRTPDTNDHLVLSLPHAQKN